MPLDEAKCTDCPKIKALINQILLNFNFDPQSLQTHLTHQNLKVFENKDIKIKIMTKIFRETVWEGKNSAVFDGAKFSKKKKKKKKVPIPLFQFSLINNILV